MTNLEKEIEWLEKVLSFRIGTTIMGKKIPFPNAPEINDGDNYGKLIHDLGLSINDRILLMTVLIPHLNPVLFDEIIQNEITKAGHLPEIGGTRSSQFRGFLPTGETILFLLGSKGLKERLTSKKWLETESILWSKSWVSLIKSTVSDPEFSGVLSLSIDLLDQVLEGKTQDPKFGIDFPAKPINTELEWSDLILDKRTKEDLEELKSWNLHKKMILEKWGLNKRLKSGYRALFFGSPGTGKTLAASLLGKHTKTKVYRIDLSMVVSKYIGETEKNLSRLFDKALHKNWILFFDEADSLFGKRTGVRDAHDKYANQEVSYLLQKIDEYEGLVILASNLKGNIDDAFLRRFQSVIYFPMPNHKERLKLWKSLWPLNMNSSEDIDIQSLANKFELTGANILNVIQFACIKAAEADKEQLSLRDLHIGIRRELKKEGKLL